MPRLGDSVTEGTLTQWFKAVGDSVAAGEPIGEIGTDKVDVDLESPVAGTITALLVQPDETVPVGAVLARIAG